MKSNVSRHKQGSVLIFALWVMLFLTILVVNIGFGTRQKINLLQRLETRSKLRLTAEAGIKTAVAVLVDDAERTQFQYTPIAKHVRHHNPVQFRSIPVGDGIAVVSYEDYRRASYGSRTRYGVSDEEGKLNVNVVGTDVLRSLIRQVLDTHPDEAGDLAEAIVDWRTHGTSGIHGFYSEGYYGNLQYPYKKKDEFYETLHELLLVEGMTRQRYERLRPFITIYGDGLVNINTASMEVLMALGLDEEVAGKLVDTREDPDSIDDTQDDHIFYRTYDVASEIDQVYELKSGERSQLDRLSAQLLIGTTSENFTIRSQAHLEARPDEVRTIEAVYNVRERMFLYWYEK